MRQAKTAEETDWSQIAALYPVLVRTTPSQVIALNHAVAVAMSRVFETGLDQIEQIAELGDLDSYYLYHAARADCSVAAGGMKKRQPLTNEHWALPRIL